METQDYRLCGLTLNDFYSRCNLLRKTIKPFYCHHTQHSKRFVEMSNE